MPISNAGIDAGGGLQVTAEFDEHDIAVYNEVLNGLQKNFRADAAWAENRTATYANKEIKRAVTQRYQTAQKNLEKAATKHRATYSNPAIIEYKGKPIDLKKFRVTTPKSGAKGKQLKANSVKPLGFEGQRAFVVRFKSGHEAVAHRRGKDRLPIKTLYGSSVPKMVDGKVIQRIGPLISAKLEHYMIDRMRYRMGKANGTIK